MSPEILTAAATPKVKAPKRLSEAALRVKHPQIVEGSLRYDSTVNKQKVTINTVDAKGEFDGNTREIATSDLHQCRWTQETKDAMDSAKRSAKGKAKRAARKEVPASEMPVGEDAEARLLAQS